MTTAAPAKWNKAWESQNAGSLGDRGNRAKKLIAAGKKCRRCEMLVFTTATAAKRGGCGVFNPDVNRKAHVDDDGLALCAACVTEIKKAAQV